MRTTKTASVKLQKTAARGDPSFTGTYQELEDGRDDEVKVTLTRSQIEELLSSQGGFDAPPQRLSEQFCQMVVDTLAANAEDVDEGIPDPFDPSSYNDSFVDMMTDFVSKAKKDLRKKRAANLGDTLNDASNRDMQNSEEYKRLAEMPIDPQAQVALQEMSDMEGQVAAKGQEVIDMLTQQSAKKLRAAMAVEFPGSANDAGFDTWFDKNRQDLEYEWAHFRRGREEHPFLQDPDDPKSFMDYARWQYPGAEKTASVKLAADDPLAANEAKAPPAATFKEYKKRPEDVPAMNVKHAPEAPPEVYDVYHTIQQANEQLNRISSIVMGAQKKLMEEISRVEQNMGKSEEIEKRQAAYNKLARLLALAENKTLNLGEKALVLIDEQKDKPYNPTPQWKLEKLIEKFDGAQEYLDKAIQGAQNLATKETVYQIQEFPNAPSKKAAMGIDVVDELIDALTSYIGSLQGV